MFSTTFIKVTFTKKVAWINQGSAYMSSWHAGELQRMVATQFASCGVLGKIEYPLTNYCSHPRSTLAHRLSPSAMHGNQSRDWKPIAGGEYPFILPNPVAAPGHAERSADDINFRSLSNRSSSVVEVLSHTVNWCKHFHSSTQDEGKTSGHRQKSFDRLALSNTPRQFSFQDLQLMDELAWDLGTRLKVSPATITRGWFQTRWMSFQFWTVAMFRARRKNSPSLQWLFLVSKFKKVQRRRSSLKYARICALNLFFLNSLEVKSYLER